MKKLCVFILVLLTVALCTVSACAEPSLPRVVDSADLFTASEESALLAKLDSLSQEHDYDIVVYTVESIGGKSPYRYATDAYAAGGYGRGEDGESGVMVIIEIDARECHIEFFGEQRLSEGTVLLESSVDYLSAGDYYGAMDMFADTVDSELSFPFFIIFVAAVIVGFVVALIATGIMKGKLKSVYMQSNAREYVRKDSFKLTHSRDLFLYSHVTRVARPKNTSSGGSRSGGGGSRGGSVKF